MPSIHLINLPNNTRVTRRLNPPLSNYQLVLGGRFIQLLEWWSIPRRGWIIILGELAVIIGLAGWVYSEYVNNTYFQSYVNNLSPVIVPILSVGFGVTSATVATLLYFTMRNVRRSRGLAAEDETNRRTLAEKKTGKKPLVQSSRSERTVTAAARGPRSRSFAPGSNLSKRSGAHESRDEEDESE